MFEYTVIVDNDIENIATAMQELCTEGWRVHTYTPFTVRGNAGVDSVYYNVVLERFVEEPDEEENPLQEALAMRG
jgi:hypothetical protein